MENSKSLAVFEDKEVRHHYDETSETWHFSVVDIVAALTDSVNPADYLKNFAKGMQNWYPT